MSKTEQPEDAGLDQAERFWEEHYRRHDRLWSGRPNPVLAEVAGPLRPGTALDLGCGEGGDAVWLATCGWSVTAVDISITALHRVTAHAVLAGVQARVRTEQHDLARSLPEGTHDLVSACYLASPVDFPRERVLRTAADSVAPGGLLLIVDHASVPPWSWAHPDSRFPTPAELLASLELAGGQWHPERVEAPEREATGPGGQIATVRDNVVAVRRLETVG